MSQITRKRSLVRQSRMDAREQRKIQKEVQQMEHWKAREKYIPGVQSSWISPEQERAILQQFYPPRSPTDFKHIVEFLALAGFSKADNTIAQNEKKNPFQDPEKWREIEQRQEVAFVTQKVRLAGSLSSPEVQVGFLQGLQKKYNLNERLPRLFSRDSFSRSSRSAASRQNSKSRV